MSDDKLIEGQDFYFNEGGKMVLTSDFLKRRGYCCMSGCLHCPYGVEKIDPDTPLELRDQQEVGLEEKYAKYLDGDYEE